MQDATHVAADVYCALFPVHAAWIVLQYAVQSAVLPVASIPVPGASTPFPGASMPVPGASGVPPLFLPHPTPTTNASAIANLRMEDGRALRHDHATVQILRRAF